MQTHADFLASGVSSKFQSKTTMLMFSDPKLSVCWQKALWKYLEDWLVLERSEHELRAHRSLLLSHLEHLGLKINLAYSSLSSSQ